MKFAQTVGVRSDNPAALIKLLADYDQAKATADIAGYIGTRLLANRDDPGHFLILAEFAEVDDEASSADEAELNNERQETQRWADDLRELIAGEPEWIHFDELYRTGITGDLRTG